MEKAEKRLGMIGFIAIAQSFLTVHIIGGAGLFLGATVFAWCLYRFFRLISLRTRNEATQITTPTYASTTSSNRTASNPSSCFTKPPRP
jgi:hypothetical protein